MAFEVNAETGNFFAKEGPAKLQVEPQEHWVYVPDFFDCELFSTLDEAIICFHPDIEDELRQQIEWQAW
jgi:hypothetical protein